jgi:hypothetical protein
MVVLAILTVAAALAAPSLAELHRGAELRSAASDVVALASLARSTACLRAEPVELRIAPGERLMHLVAGKAPEVRSSGIESIDRLFAQGDGAGARDLGLASARRPLPASLRCADVKGREEVADVRVLFLADGTASEARIRLAEPDGRDVVVRVDPVTGGARIEKQP